MTQFRHQKSFLAKIAPNTQTWIAIVSLIVLAVFNYKAALVITAGLLSLKPKAILVGLATVAFGLYLTRVAVKKMRKKNKHAPGFVSMRS
ncbi:unnamed protein product [Aphanomyces euteiches]|uniref:Uncharacterized protein n=1 Tax=Aphanomyces euteiches TaxID=100861 RepID=A0A6G0XT63_9STRA|nr:hypothetical protein Ae201684_001740 [Aphanomyces euteiches]KAH9075404.1 hypothetical protein Ae201684P_004084 [Aphanomyces euteiches]KAH9113101.1 hypothetical protein AeMF1_012675 [Aphanomyces euteiches]KAH9121877.1 hypothetical protein LEN26_010481 [Aphanomyces euteiches]KAH9144060.1 hypothetical protein AeRB84_011976 [Aphanomyces euteiches]